MTTKADRFRTFMLHEIGEEYQWGAEGTGGAAGDDEYDCSGLGYAAFRAAGVSMPRTTADGYFRMGHRIARPTRVGDYGVHLDGRGHATHIVWYIGEKDGVGAEVEARGEAYGVRLYTVAQATARGIRWCRFDAAAYDLGPLTRTSGVSGYIKVDGTHLLDAPSRSAKVTAHLARGTRVKAYANYGKFRRVKMWLGLRRGYVLAANIKEG